MSINAKHSIISMLFLLTAVFSCIRYFVWLYFLIFLVSYVRKGKDLAVDCVAVRSKQKYADARYQWQDHLLRGAARNNFTLYGDGVLEILGAVLADTDTYICSVYMPTGDVEEYSQSIIGKLHS